MASNREIAPHSYFVARQIANQADGRRSVAIGGVRIVRQVDIVFVRSDNDAGCASFLIRRRDGHFHAVFVDRERAGFGAEVPLQIVPLPTQAKQVAAKITCVADDVAADFANT